MLVPYVEIWPEVSPREPPLTESNADEKIYYYLPDRLKEYPAAVKAMDNFRYAMREVVIQYAKDLPMRASHTSQYQATYNAERRARFPVRKSLTSFLLLIISLCRLKNNCRFLRHPSHLRRRSSNIIARLHHIFTPTLTTMTTTTTVSNWFTQVPLALPPQTVNRKKGKGVRFFTSEGRRKRMIACPLRLLLQWLQSRLPARFLQKRDPSLRAAIFSKPSPQVSSNCSSA